LLREDQLVIIEARVMQRGGEDARRRVCACCRPFTISRRSAGAMRRPFARVQRAADAARLAELIAPFRNGTCPIVVRILHHGIGGEFELPDVWSANSTIRCSRVARRLAPENVRVVY
jgi:DNA polymerase-3 subunit alpha